MIIVDRCTVTAPTTANFVGVHIGDDATDATVRGTTISGTNASGSRGILCESSAQLLGNKISSFKHSTSGIGIDVEADSLDGVVINSYDGPDGTHHTVIEECRTGVYSGGYSRPTVRSARIKGGSYSFWVSSTAAGDFGVEFPSTENGGCDVTNVATKFVRADPPRILGWNDVYAVMNWWGTSNATTIASKMSAGVTWQPALGGDPLSGLSRDDLGLGGILPDRAELRVFPNPAMESVAIEVTLPGDGSDLKVMVFSVAGQLVREFVFDRPTAGLTRVTWDGADSRGHQVPGGMYYVRAVAGSALEQTRKILIAR